MSEDIRSLAVAVALVTALSVIAHKATARYGLACLFVGLSWFSVGIALDALSLIREPERWGQWVGNIPFSFGNLFFGCVIASVVGIPFHYIRKRRVKR